MVRIETTRSIRAPREEVFDTKANAEEHARVVPEIIEIEFLTEQQLGAGTRFRETRRFGRRSVTAELEITEHERPNRVRFIANGGGTVWDTTFTYLNTREGTEAHVLLEVQPRTLVGRLTNRFIRAAVRQGVERDLDRLKTHFEREAASTR